MNNTESRRKSPGRVSARSVLLALLIAPGVALALQPGTYRCSSYNVSGGGGNCRLAPPIVIHADGTYAESSTVGTYRVVGDQVKFSESRIRGPGQISGGNQIAFEYEYRGWRHAVTYQCRDCGAAAGTPRDPERDAARSGARVWAQVRLKFDRADGVLGWVNSAHLVPADKAAEFAASGASQPPAGSATGSAFLDGRQTLVANFRQASAGRRYVVFLDSGRQRLPVAEVFVPPSPPEQTIELDARLDFRPAGAQSPRSDRGTGARTAVIAREPQPASPDPAPPYPVPPYHGAEALAQAQQTPHQGPAASPGAGEPAASPRPSPAQGFADFIQGVEGFTKQMRRILRPGESTADPNAAPPYPSPPTGGAYSTRGVETGSPPPYLPSAPPGSSPPYPPDPSAALPYPSPPAVQAAPYRHPDGPAAPGQKCHPLIPKYSQPGCIE